jgi:hypothetical protein
VIAPQRPQKASMKVNRVGGKESFNGEIFPRAAPRPHPFSHTTHFLENTHFETELLL